MVVEHTNKSKYVSDKLTLSRFVGQDQYKLILTECTETNHIILFLNVVFHYF